MTSILVRKDPDTGQWYEWTGPGIVNQMFSSFNAQYADGRIVEVPCDPYPVAVQLDGNSVRGFYDQGIWSLEEVTNVGGKIAVPFVVPDGKRTVGNPSYSEGEDGVVSQSYAVEDIPPPPPEPTPEEKVAAMMNAFGLTLAEFHDVYEAASAARMA